MFVYMCVSRRSKQVLNQDLNQVVVVVFLFERSEFLITTCEKKKTDRLCGCVCVDARLISWF